MSDSVKKWHEMKEDKFAAVESKKQDKDHPERLTFEIKKQAYTLLTKYDEDVIRMANRILDIDK